MAFHLGKTVAELTHSLTATELAGWMAFFEHFPPDERDDWRTAMLCASIYRANGKRVQVKDFMPRKPRKKQSADEQMRVFKALTGGK